MPARRDANEPSAQSADAETTPLIANGNSVDNGENGNADRAPGKPLPMGQIAILCFTRVMEPISFFSILPYIAAMVQKNGNVAEVDIGLYSGLIESVFSITQMFFLIYWGRLADRIGRKPVLLMTSIGTALFMSAFGCSTTLWEMFLYRGLAGLFSGSNLVIRTMIGDHCTEATQAVAYSYFAAAGNIGIVVGPFIGGFLADVATQYPSVFKGIAFFENYPYALPGFTVTALTLLAALLVAFFLEETLQGEQHTPGTAPETMSLWEITKSPGVSPVLFVYGYVMFLAFSFTATVPVALYTSVRNGGMGFSQQQIALWTAGQGGSQTIWLLIIFPFVHRRIGTMGVLRACAIAYPATFMFYIGLNYILRGTSEAAHVLFLIYAPLMVMLGPGVAMAFTAAQLSLNQVSPGARELATLNAIAMTVISGIRAFAPGAATAFFAVGVNHPEILGGHLAWWVMVILSTVFWISLKWHPKDNARAT